MAYVRWEPWEVKVLMQNRFNRMIAYEALGHRSKLSIDSKLQKSEIKGIKRSKYRRWSIDDMRFIQRKREEGMKWIDIGAMLNIDETHLRNVIRYHARKGHL